jgi:hypothetical protein
MIPGKHKVGYSATVKSMGKTQITVRHITLYIAVRGDANTWRGLHVSVDSGSTTGCLFDILII